MEVKNQIKIASFMLALISTRSSAASQMPVQEVAGTFDAQTRPRPSAGSGWCSLLQASIS